MNTGEAGGEPVRPEIARKSRLLATFLLLMLTAFGASDLFSLITRPGYRPPWYGYVFLVSAAILNYLGRYALAATLALTMFPLVTLASVIGGANPGVTFGYLVIGIIGSSILFNRSGALLFDLGCLLCLLVTPLALPEQVPGYRAITSPILLVVIGSGLSILLMVLRDETERERQAALRDSEERLRLALDASLMGTWEWDEGTGVRWSERAAALLGRTPGDLPSTVDGCVQLAHPEDREALSEAFEGVGAGRNASFELSHRVILKDGSIRWIQVQGRASRGPDEGKRVNGTVLDITGRRNAEAEREALIRELERKNTELERFTYTVSHDLKSPLITVRGFLGSIERDVKDGRVDRLSSDLERVFGATARMQRLLDELLNLSRIGRIVNPPERVRFAELVDEARALVRGRLDAAHARVEVEDGLPDVFGDRSRLVQVLQNLLDNAAKFLGGQKNPRIVVGSRPSASDGRPVFFVQDNGVGVDPAHLEKMLGLFEKLDDQSEGTGVGLAIVKRIVEVHGGRVWVESEGRGRGTTVCFTLPTRPPV